MARRSKGLRSTGRGKFTKHPRTRGLAPVARAVQEFPVGSRVTIILDPSSHKGQPHHRYQGRVGVVTERRGRAYVLEVRDGGKIKSIISTPEHLKLVR